MVGLKEAVQTRSGSCQMTPPAGPVYYTIRRSHFGQTQMQRVARTAGGDSTTSGPRVDKT